MTNYNSLSKNPTRIFTLALVLLALAFSLSASRSAHADTGLPGAAVSVCQVTGSASVPQYAQVSVAADQVTAYLNQYPGSFVGTCPASSGGGGSGGGGGLPGASVSVCQVTGSASAPQYAQVSVLVSNLAAYLNQYPGSFAGTCPAPGSGGGTGGGGGLPGASVSVCQITGSASAPQYAQVSVLVSDLAAYLNRYPGSFAGACPASGGGSGGGGGGVPNGSLTVCHIAAQGLHAGRDRCAPRW